MFSVAGCLPVWRRGRGVLCSLRLYEVVSSGLKELGVIVPGAERSEREVCDY